MKRISVLSFFMLYGFFIAATGVAQGEQPRGEQRGDISELVGNWSGESICVNKEKFPACNDEQVIYRIVPAKGKSDTVTITADKIVNGKPETMGVFDFVYDPQKHTLSSEFKNSRVHLIFELAVKGDILEGTLAALPDRTIVRRIKVKKDQAARGET